MFLLIPQNYGRDLSDTAVVTTGGEEWLRQRSVLYRPLAGVPALAPGESTVTIGTEGFNEWRTLPATGAVSINGADCWRLYGADFKQKAAGMGNGSAPLSGPGPNYLILFGVPGTAISLNLAP